MVRLGRWEEGEEEDSGSSRASKRLQDYGEFIWQCESRSGRGDRDGREAEELETWNRIAKEVRGEYVGEKVDISRTVF